MPRRTRLETSPMEHAQMLAALRRARYGYLLALHMVLLCAAGRSPTEIAAALFCSRSSVYRTVRAYHAGTLGLACDDQGRLAAPVRTTVLTLPLELCHPGPDVANQARDHRFCRNDAPLAPRAWLGVETGQAGGER